MAKNLEAALKAKELYRVMTRASEIKGWFINNGKKLTQEQREKFGPIWTLEKELAEKVFNFSRMF